MHSEAFGKEELSEVKSDKPSGASNENFSQESYPVLIKFLAVLAELTSQGKWANENLRDDSTKVHKSL